MKRVAGQTMVNLLPLTAVYTVAKRPEDEQIKQT